MRRKREKEKKNHSSAHRTDSSYKVKKTTSFVKSTMKCDYSSWHITDEEKTEIINKCVFELTHAASQS